jgi:hypothetical protein
MLGNQLHATPSRRQGCGVPEWWKASDGSLL